MTDLLGIDALLSEEDKATRDRVAALVDEHIRPHVAQWYEDAVLPESIFPVLAEAGLFGMHLEGYGCAGRTAVGIRAGHAGARGRRFGNSHGGLGAGIAGDVGDI